jgi:hypothetical protein
MLGGQVTDMGRSAGAIAGLALALSLGAADNASAQAKPAIDLSTVSVRAPDSFYDVPDPVPDSPGSLLAAEPLDADLPEGVRAWRIRYATTVDDATPAIAVATVFAAAAIPDGPRPAIMWLHGTTGLDQRCMPSLVSSPHLGIPAFERALAAGWVIVATDYSFAEDGGPHPYLIGDGEARAGLDSIRAARAMGEPALGQRTVVWGHSQGGHSALWTGIVGPSYAPDVEIAGVAAIAPPADMGALVRANPGVDARLGPWLAAAYSRFYPDVSFDRAILPDALEAAREIRGLCGFLPAEEPARVAELLATFGPRSLALDDDPALAARLEANTAAAPIAAPLLIAQGLADPVVLPAMTDNWVKARCAAGQRLDHWSFAGVDHGAIVQPGAALEGPLLDWTEMRFAGASQAEGCARASY